MIGASPYLLLSTHVFTYHLVLISHSLLALLNVIVPQIQLIRLWKRLRPAHGNLEERLKPMSEVNVLWAMSMRLVNMRSSYHLQCLSQIDSLLDCLNYWMHIHTLISTKVSIGFQKLRSSLQTFVSEVREHTICMNTTSGPPHTNNKAQHRLHVGYSREHQ